MPISPLRLVYLGLVVVGTVWPMSYFLQWFGMHGVSVTGMVEAWHANPATSGLVWDLTIAAAALVVWMVAEVYQRKDWWVLALCLPATFCIGVSCGLPLYLFLRARPIR